MCKDKPDFSEGFMLYTTILTSTTRNPEPDSAKKCLPTLHQNQCLNSEVKSGNRRNQIERERSNVREAVARYLAPKSTKSSDRKRTDGEMKRRAEGMNSCIFKLSVLASSGSARKDFVL